MQQVAFLLARDTGQQNPISHPAAGKSPGLPAGVPPLVVTWSSVPAEFIPWVAEGLSAQQAGTRSLVLWACVYTGMPGLPLQL